MGLILRVMVFRVGISRWAIPAFRQRAVGALARTGALAGDGEGWKRGCQGAVQEALLRASVRQRGRFIQRVMRGDGARGHFNLIAALFEKCYLTGFGDACFALRHAVCSAKSETVPTQEKATQTIPGGKPQVHIFYPERIAKVCTYACVVPTSH